MPVRPVRTYANTFIINLSSEEVSVWETWHTPPNLLAVNPMIENVLALNKEDTPQNRSEPIICRYIDEGVVGSGMGLLLIGGHWRKVLPQNSKGAS